MWRGAKADGLLHGVLVWGLSVILTLSLGLLTGSALFGPIGQIAAQLNVAAGPTPARLVAGWTVLFLGLAVAAAGIGGGMGTMERLWSKRRAAGDTP